MQPIFHRVMSTSTALGLLAGLGIAGGMGLPLGIASAEAQDELNVYSARHYEADDALFSGFTKETGIEVNIIEGSDEELVTRIVNEGANSPADVLITVDAGRLWRADQEGVFQPVESEVLEERIPANLRHPDGHWFGFSTRIRTLYYNPEIVDEPPQTYEDLAAPRFEGLVCIRSSSNIYNLSLMASLIEHHGAEKAEEWANGVVSNFARDPQGGDTDQIRGVASGECGVALANHYYYMRLVRSDDDADQEVVENTELVWANQEGRGAHQNVSGAGVLQNAPHKDAAVKFLEYLATDEAQAYFANGNNEYPAVESALDNPVLEEFGRPKLDDVNVSVYGENQPEAQMIFDRAGWK
ncbi:MAG: Fe(3+) ABC transporter substrate-binding protein [Pseudomonadota bacterium]|uniref:Fe(3+) ABC transporter substrate-binding protein n=1 Tax=Fodinicurvata fenggangensis TaxID=1121830 RepID=UPI000AD5C75D|nr:Fe(3+) ABC transporter substrate-binding protein [Fodinicurvata fenggangensis]